MDVTTPLAGIPYKDQVSSKEEEVDILLQELQQEIIEYRAVNIFLAEVTLSIFLCMF